MKICNKCSIEKDLNCFRPRGGTRKGHRSACINCERANNNEREVKNRLARQAAGLKSRKQEWIDNNPEKKKEYRAKQREYEKEHIAETRIKERIRYQDPERRANKNARMRKWRAENKDSVLAYREQYKLRVLSNGNEEVFKILVELVKNPCTYCGLAASGLDHIVPLSRGATNDITNLTSCCASCNSSKKNKLVTEWSQTDRINQMTQDKQKEIYVN